MTEPTLKIVKPSFSEKFKSKNATDHQRRARRC